ncbi:hypothetical protein VFPFJ_03647 [Purpureocillium lilacinum]|uniref:Uncharacterized protein n=1 Tax=Purpureocillium lilacinum TaxID=33203 RepID=A0A179HNL3_PURLI|nr:hypothetical protein VFPFJ_03647 [Purpureocillium lilacinum]OAQ91907.1 hypothetical protein VFPFJ_03647 [Purpureocillium lilacinum]
MLGTWQHGYWRRDLGVKNGSASSRRPGVSPNGLALNPVQRRRLRQKERVRPANHLPSAIGLNAANAETAGRDARHRGGGGGPLQPVWSVDVPPSPSRSGAWGPWFREHGVSDRVVCNRSALHCIA